MLWLENGVWRVDNECWVDREGQVKGCNGKDYMLLTLPHGLGLQGVSQVRRNMDRTGSTPTPTTLTAT